MGGVGGAGFRRPPASSRATMVWTVPPPVTSSNVSNPIAGREGP
jgi:hypothetical protein